MPTLGPFDRPTPHHLTFVVRALKFHVFHSARESAYFSMSRISKPFLLGLMIELCPYAHSVHPVDSVVVKYFTAVRGDLGFRVSGCRG